MSSLGTQVSIVFQVFTAEAPGYFKALMAALQGQAGASLQEATSEPLVGRPAGGLTGTPVLLSVLALYEAE